MKKKLTKKDVGFTQIKNNVLQDKNISLKAKGLFGYLYSKPKDWDFSNRRIALEMKESANTISKVLKELEASGYLERKRQSTGRMQYYITFEPCTKNDDVAKKPCTKKATVAKSHCGKVGTVSNTDIYSNTDNNSNTDLAKQSFAGKEIAEVIKLFEIVNPSIETLYGNKTERSACERLLKKWTFQEIAAVVNLLPEINSDQYAKGKSIKPTELERNLGYIKAYVDQRKSNTINNYIL